MPNNQSWTNPGSRVASSSALRAIFRAVPAGDFIEIAGSGFGLTPNVVFYRKFQGEAGTPVPVAPEDGEIGVINFNNNGAAYFGDIENGASGFALHVQDGGIRGGGTGDRGFSYDMPQHRRFRHTYWVGVPVGSVYPGSNSHTTDGPQQLEHGQFPLDSGCKVSWRQHSPGANADNTRADVCIYTHIGNGTHAVAGNATVPMSTVFGGTIAASIYQFGKPNVIDYAQDCDPENSAINNSFQQFRITNDLLNTTKPSGTRTSVSNKASFAGTGLVSHGSGDSYSHNVFGGLNRKLSINPAATQMIISNVYDAVESSDGVPDWRQCLWACNAATIADSTKRVALYAPEWEWSDALVRFPRHRVPGWATHLIIEKADGTETARAVNL